MAALVDVLYQHILRNSYNFCSITNGSGVCRPQRDSCSYYGGNNGAFQWSGKNWLGIIVRSNWQTQHIHSVFPRTDSGFFAASGGGKSAVVSGTVVYDYLLLWRRFCYHAVLFRRSLRHQKSGYFTGIYAHCLGSSGHGRPFIRCLVAIHF